MRRPSTPSKYSSNLTRSRHPSVSPNSLDHSLQEHLQTRSITASKCISQLARSWPPSVSPDPLDYGLQVCITMASKCLSPNSLDHGLQVYLQTCSITASKCISKVTRSQPRSESLSSLDCHLQAHLELLSSTACSLSRYSVCRWVAI